MGLPICSGSLNNSIPYFGLLTTIFVPWTFVATTLSPR